MKTLIVYFTRTGTTRRVAERLAVVLPATLCPLTEESSRMGPLGYARCLLDVAFTRDVKLQALAHDPAAYDLVLIGTPIWAGHLSSPLRSFVHQHAPQIRRCALFCTMGGSGAAGVFAELQGLLGQAPLATMACTNREVDADGSEQKIQHFVAALSQTTASSTPTSRLRHLA